MTDKYMMHLVVPVRLVGDILQIMQGEGIMVKCEPYIETEPSTKPRSKYYVGGKKNKGIRGVDLAIEAGKSGVRERADFKRIFTAKGFSPNSASACLSQLCDEGRFRRVGEGIYEFIA